MRVVIALLHGPILVNMIHGLDLYLIWPQLLGGGGIKWLSNSAVGGTKKDFFLGICMAFY